jgi:hypothetical protein
VLIPQGVEEQMNAVEAVLTKSRAHHEINYNDFVAAIMWRRIQYDEEKMQMVFEALDVHRQGFLTRESIRQVVGLDKKQEEIDRMFDEADANQDGCIDYDRFVGLWKAHVVDVEYKPYVEKVERIRMLLQAASSSSSASSSSAASPFSLSLARTDSAGSTAAAQAPAQVPEQGPAQAPAGAVPATPPRPESARGEAEEKEEDKKRKPERGGADDAGRGGQEGATVNSKRRRV